MNGGGEVRLRSLISSKGPACAVISWRHLGAFALSLACIVQPAGAAEIGNAETGGRFAAEVCSDCHAVKSGDFDSLHLDAPAFQVIADRPATTALALGVWFRSPHPNMPNFVLTPDETANLIAYILSLRSAD